MVGFYYRAETRTVACTSQTLAVDEAKKGKAAAIDFRGLPGKERSGVLLCGLFIVQCFDIDAANWRRANKLHTQIATRLS